MHVLDFLQTNLAKSHISCVDNGRSKLGLDQTKKEVQVGKIYFHNELSESNEEEKSIIKELLVKKSIKRHGVYFRLSPRQINGFGSTPDHEERNDLNLTSRYD